MNKHLAILSFYFTGKFITTFLFLVVLNSRKGQKKTSKHFWKEGS